MTHTINTIQTINFIRNEFSSSKYRYLTKWLCHNFFYNNKIDIQSADIFQRYRIDLLQTLLGLDDTFYNREIIDWLFTQISFQQFYLPNIIEYILPNIKSPIKPIYSEKSLTNNMIEQYVYYKNTRTILFIKSVTRPINTYFELLLLDATGLANTYKSTEINPRKNDASKWKFRKNEKWFYNYINQRFRLALQNYITSEYSQQSLEYLNSILNLICKFSKCRKFIPPSYDKLLYEAVYFGHIQAVAWLFNNTNKFIEHGILNKDTITEKKLTKLFEKAAVHNYNRPELFRLLYNHFLMENQSGRAMIGVPLEEFLKRILVNVIDAYNWFTYFHPQLLRKWPTELIDLLVELCPYLTLYLKRNLNGTFRYERLNSKFRA